MRFYSLLVGYAQKSQYEWHNHRDDISYAPGGILPSRKCIDCREPRVLLIIIPPPNIYLKLIHAYNNSNLVAIGLMLPLCLKPFTLIFKLDYLSDIQTDIIAEAAVRKYVTSNIGNSY